ncbi:hypothetical protein BS78_02G178400 [Paspalum vaginatum]|nr:hypothetical protein BS78_02G178400 [Paspalum vaginatum]
MWVRKRTMNRWSPRIQGKVTRDDDWQLLARRRRRRLLRSAAGGSKIPAGSATVSSSPVRLLDRGGGRSRTALLFRAMRLRGGSGREAWMHAWLGRIAFPDNCPSCMS